MHVNAVINVIAVFLFNSPSSVSPCLRLRVAFWVRIYLCLVFFCLQLVAVVSLDTFKAIPLG